MRKIIYDSSAKSLFTPALAQRWGHGFDARPRMSMKWGEAARECEYRGGLWECEARNNPQESFCTITIYVLACIILLCSFFSFNESSHREGFYVVHQNGITRISIPRGIHMDIKSEESHVTLVSNVKNRTPKNMSVLRYILLVLMMTAAGCVRRCTHPYGANVSIRHSGFFIIQYIHKKDGRKR